MNLLERIDRWAVATPQAIAHRSCDRQITYGELVERSNALAARLHERYGEDSAPIAVLGHREPEMLVGFLGVAKSGRAYIPIDTALPRERIDHILTIAQPKLVLDPEQISTLSQGNDFERPPAPDANRPFYIIFTSGSTGIPKGIVITRRCLEHFVDWILKEQQLEQGSEVFLNQAPFSFDLSVMDLYCSLASGGTLFSIGRDLLANPKLLYRALAISGLTTWVSTPSFAEMCLIEKGFNAALLPRVRRFLFCGEILLPNTARLLLERFPNAQVWNFYGPTEATVATTSIQIDRQSASQSSPLPVGRAMPGSRVIVVNEKGQEILDDGRGEIVIKGPNVSPGYLDRPDLTATRFFQENGQRGYRTGDWGRIRDGVLFFEGRRDHQVKVNGYRIELGDLETNLRALARVRDAVVVPFSKNGKVQWLAAFILPTKEQPAEDSSLATELREQLRQRLPSYMLPRRFILMESFPMTANGKVDRQKLAESL